MPSAQHIEIRLEDNIQLYECPAPDRAQVSAISPSSHVSYEGTFITMTEVSGVVLGVAGFKLPLSLEPHNQREEVCNEKVASQECETSID
jgi:hypothetical protein